MKDCVGNIYLETLLNEFDTKDNYPFREYVYIFDFDDTLTVECRELCAKYTKNQSISAFAKFCDMTVPTGFVEPTLKEGTFAGDSEYVQMLDERGERYFIMQTAKGWYNQVCCLLVY